MVRFLWPRGRFTHCRVIGRHRTALRRSDAPYESNGDMLPLPAKRKASCMVLRHGMDVLRFSIRRRRIAADYTADARIGVT